MNSHAQLMRQKRVNQIKAKGSAPECKIAEVLSKAKIKFQEQKGFLAGVNKDTIHMVPFYLPKPYKMVITIDNHANDKYYKSRGFRILNLTSEFIKNHSEEIIDCVYELYIEPKGTVWDR